MSIDPTPTKVEEHTKRTAFLKAKRDYWRAHLGKHITKVNPSKGGRRNAPRTPK